MYEGCDVLFEGVAHEDLAGDGEHFGFHACVFTGDGEVAFFEDAIEVLVHGVTSTSSTEAKWLKMVRRETPARSASASALRAP